MSSYIKKNWSALLLCLSIGVAIGYCLDRITDTRFRMYMLESGKFRSSIVRQLRDTLSMDEAQTQRADAIVGQTQKKFAALKDNINVERDKIIRDSIEECKSFLNKEQQRKLDVLYKRAKEAYERERREHMEVRGSGTR